MHNSASTAAMNERGEQGMGFSQTTTAHHFLMKPDGGVILVEVKNSADAPDRDGIRQHLAHITEAFRNGGTLKFRCLYTTLFHRERQT